MILYSNNSGQLAEVKETPFKLERDIQNLFEANLLTIMGLNVVKAEFSIKGKRIDTLAFDAQSKAFIIIEYKRDRSVSVVDQGFMYLSLMLENKAEFIVEYNESLGQNLRREEVDWSQTRVVFVSTSFTDNQIQATNFKDIAIELWEVKRFANNTVSITSIKKSNTTASIKPFTQQNEELEKVTREIKVYTEEDHLNSTTEPTKELYEKFKIGILNLSDDIEIHPKKEYIAFKKGKNIVDITIQKKMLKLFINLRKGSLDDPRHIARDMFGIGHWGNGDYEIQVGSDENLEYILSLIKQAL